MISVIIPTYNRQDYLQRAMLSVLSQKRPCDELLVVDDGSEDESGPLVQALAQQSEIPIFLLRQGNRGAAAARNLGIREARGDYLAFLDSDDWWHPQKLALQVTAMESAPQYLISHTREIWYRRGQRVNQKKKHDPPHGAIFAPSLKMCVVGMSTTVIRRELFTRYGLFDEELPCCEDYDLWLRVGWEQPFLLVPEALTYKDGGRGDQLSSVHRQGMDVYRIRALAKLLASGVLSAAQQQQTIEEFVRKCRIYGNGCVKHGRPEEGAHYLNLARSVLEKVEEKQ